MSRLSFSRETILENFARITSDLEQHQQCTEKKVQKFSGKFTKGCVIGCMNSSDKELKS